MRQPNNSDLCIHERRTTVEHLEILELTCGLGWGGHGHWGGGGATARGCGGGCVGLGGAGSAAQGEAPMMGAGHGGVSARGVVRWGSGSGSPQSWFLVVVVVRKTRNGD